MFDAPRHRLLVFGGFDGVARNRVWAFQTAAPSGWSLVPTLGPQPPGRGHHGAIFDADRNRMIVYGGQDDSTYKRFGEVWQLALSGTPTWSPLLPSGPAPPLGEDFCVAFDRLRNRMLMFGGSGDVWSLSLGDSVAWTPLLPAGNGGPLRYLATAVCDSMGDRLVVFGGFSWGGGQLNDVWSLSLSDPVAWTQLAPLGTPPPERACHSAVMDPVQRRMVVFGGGGGPPDLNDTWFLSLGDTVRWTQLAPSANDPPARHFAAAVFDADSAQVIVACGVDYWSEYFNDVWKLRALASGSWSRLSEGGREWDAGVQSGLFYDIQDDGLVGLETTFNALPTTAQFSLTAWTMPLDGVPRRHLVVPTGIAPAARFDYSVIFDPTRRRLVLFGGNPGQFTLSLNEVWALDLSGAPSWLKLSPAGQSPPNMLQHSAIYDPPRDRMIVFGGSTDTLMNGYPYGTDLNDTWALSFAGTPTWTRLSTSGTPPAPRRSHGAIYDPVEQRMIIYAGYYDQTVDLWALSLSDSPQWTTLHTWDIDNSPRYLKSASTVYDPESDRMIVFGGYELSERPLSDTWAINLHGAPVWTPIASATSRPAPRERAGIVYDPIRRRMLVQGGGVESPYLRTYSDLWEMRFASPLSVDLPVAATTGLILESPRPNPMGASARITFSLPQPARVSLAVYDVTGRRVASLREGPAPAGPSVESWDGRSRAGQRLPVGVYLVALSTGGHRQVRRLVLLEPRAH